MSKSPEILALKNDYHHIVVEPIGKRTDSDETFTDQLCTEARRLGLCSQEIILDNNLKLLIQITSTPSPHTPNHYPDNGNREKQPQHFIIWYWLEKNADNLPLPEPTSIGDLALYPQHQEKIANTLSNAQKSLFGANPETKGFAIYGATGHVLKSDQQKNGTGRGSQSNKITHHHIANLFEIKKNNIRITPAGKVIPNRADLEKIERQQLKIEAQRNLKWSKVIGQPTTQWLSKQKSLKSISLGFQTEPIPALDVEDKFIPTYQPMGITLSPKTRNESWTLQEAFEILLITYRYLVQLQDLIVKEYYNYWELNPEKRISILLNSDYGKKFPLENLTLGDIFNKDTLDKIYQEFKKTKPTPQQLENGKQENNEKVKAIYERIRTRMTSSKETPFPFHRNQLSVLNELLNPEQIPKEFVISELLSSAWSFEMTEDEKVSKITISPSIGSTKSGFEHLTNLSIERSTG